VSNKSQ